ncbi:MAG: hypothetical protein OEV86_15170 [Candidatus Krumholzibacteria bacterium]|nr:hypothetical protein [Candidatus Krumholzibacteria bacterium]
MRRETIGLFGDGPAVARLTARERATLRNASLILHAIRDASDDDDASFVVDIALAAYTCRELADAETIDLA